MTIILGQPFKYSAKNRNSFKIENLSRGSSVKYVGKIFRKTNISNSLIRTLTCAYQGVRNVSFSENFAYVLNGWPPVPSLIKKFKTFVLTITWLSATRTTKMGVC